MTNHEKTLAALQSDLSQQDKFRALIGSFTWPDDPIVEMIRALMDYRKIEGDFSEGGFDPSGAMEIWGRVDDAQNIILENIQSYSDFNAEEAKGEYLSDISRGC